jgi:hypothetical protein
MCALLGVMVGQAMAAAIRYQSSGDYFATVAVNGSYGWQAGAMGPGGVPGTNDTARCNWGNNTVTLSGVAPLLGNFQLGVDESGQLVVNSGGVLITTTGNSTVGNNNVCTGRLTVNTGGQVTVTNVLFVGNGSGSTPGSGTIGILTINGGTVSSSSHLWAGSANNSVGTIYITNGGSLNVGGNIGLGTINASTASGGKCSLYVQDGGVLNLHQISPTNSIQPGSVLDISGSGQVITLNDVTAVMSAYTNAGKITAYGGAGTVGIDYNNTNSGKTTLFAIAGYVPPTSAVWNPAANPSGTGKWNENGNWTGGLRPASVTLVAFNVVGATPCTVNNAAVADSVDMGNNGPGGTLIITNGGSLTCGTANPTTIGDNSNAVMVVENGGSASFGYQLWIGLNPGSDGTLIMHDGTVSVAGMFGLGYQGGKGTAHINGGILSLSQWDYYGSIQSDSGLDVAGTGQVVINGNQTASVNDFISTGQITNSGGAGLVVDYNNINVGKTTIYPVGAYVAPAQVVWNPALNPITDGLWNDSANWSGGVSPTNVTTVLFNVSDAIPCVVTNAAFARLLRVGINGPGGTLIITNGGSLTVSSDDWSAVGYNNTALMVVENGASASFGNHLWVGFNPATAGTLIMNGGTVSVGQMFGLGWSGGTGTAHINGGTLNLAQWSSSQSISGTSVLDVAGTGKVVIIGDYSASVSNYISSGSITANGGPNVFYFYDPVANKTTISAVLLPPPQQPITGVSVSGGNVSITYQTTPQHTYHIESTSRLKPTSWTPVAGSTNAATGAPVTFTFPAGSGPMFYRTVSP